MQSRDNPDGDVVDAGLLGPISQIGWYLPACRPGVG